MRLIEIHPEAELEMDESHSWYEEQQPGLGDRFVDAIRECLYQVQDNPARYRVIRGKYRRVLAKSFPYGVIYLVLPAKIVVIAVMHQSRRPGYWKNRKH